MFNRYVSKRQHILSRVADYPDPAKMRDQGAHSARNYNQLVWCWGKGTVQCIKSYKRQH